jgi:hypothetical protein
MEDPPGLHISSTTDDQHVGQIAIRIGSTTHHKESIQMPRIIAAIVLVAVLALGGGLIASTAYQAGVNTAVTTATASGAAAAAPIVVPGYGYGYGYGLHPFGFGFGIFGFLGTLLFLFIVFGLIRAIFWRGGYGRHGGWGGPGGPGGPGGSGHSHWETKANETFEDWHRRAHASTGGGPGSGPTTPPDPA